MRIRLYLRRSHADTKRGVSIELQRQACTEAVTRLGGSITGEYVDDDKSAFRDDIGNRTGMQQALAEARHYDVLMLYKYDRLARDEAVFFDLLRQFERHKVSVKSATEGSDPLGRALSGVLAAEYSRVLSMRMRDVRRYEAMQGRMVGGIPFGYDRNAGGIGVPNADAPLVRQAGELYATGEWSVQRLAAHLGINRWKLNDILKSPVYAGFVVCNGEQFIGKHEPIWDAALWQRIQAVAVTRGERSMRYAPRHDPLLAGIIVCGECGAPMWHESKRDNYRIYRCCTVRTGVAQAACRHNGANAEAAESLMIAWLIALCRIADLPARALALARSEPVTLPRPDPADALRRLARAYADGGLTDEEYERRRAALLEPPPVQAPPPMSSILPLLDHLPVLFDAATNSERRTILRAFVSEVHVQRRSIVALRPTHEGAPLLEAALLSREWVLVGESGDGGHRSLVHPPRLLAA